MLAITLHRPWDWAMAHGGKDIENRPWKPWAKVIGERIALHAGNTYDYDGSAFIKDALGMDVIPETHAGMIVATTRVVGWIKLAVDPSNTNVRHVELTSDMELDDIVRALGSKWLFGPYAWVVRNTIALPKPVPCKGAQGLWTVPADKETEVRRQEQLAAA